MTQKMQSAAAQLDNQLYESISSNHSTFEPHTQPPPHTQHNQKETQQPVTRSIVFPAKPKQFDKLFQIYKRNAEKMKRLDGEVKILETVILEQMRWNNSVDQREIVMEGIEELSLEEDQIEEFGRKRKIREDSLASLEELYETLKKINKVEDFLNIQQNHHKMMDKIRQTQEVLHYNTICNHLVILTKHRPKQVEVEERDSESISIEVSGVYYQEEAKEKQSYAIAIFNLDNLKHWLSPPNPQFDLPEENKIENLQKCRKQAEMFSNLVHRVNVTTSSTIKTISYSHKHGLIFVHEHGGSILVYNLHEQLQQTIQLDKLDQLLLLEVRNDELVLATKEGVVRLFSISSKKLRLVKVFICFWRELTEISSYKLIGNENLERLLFTTRKTVCQYDLKSNIITQVGMIEDKTVDFIHSRPRMARALQKALLEKDLGKEFIEKIEVSQIMKTHEQLTDYELIHIWSPIESQKTHHLLFGDSEGSLQLLTI